MHNPLEKKDINHGVTQMFYDLIEEMMIDAEMDQIEEEP